MGSIFEIFLYADTVIVAISEAKSFLYIHQTDTIAAGILIVHINERIQMIDFIYNFFLNSAAIVLYM